MTEAENRQRSRASSGSRRVRKGRQARASQVNAQIDQPPFKHHKRRFTPTTLISEDELESIHQASLEVLRDTGINVLLPEARRLFAEAGCSIDDERVRFDPEMVLDTISDAPSEFVIEARNPAHNLTFGGDNVCFTAVASPPNSADTAGGRRAGNKVDFQNFVRLTQHLNAIQLNGGYPVEPADWHPSVRHIHATRDLAILTDKVVGAYSLGAQRNRDSLEILRLAHGLNEDEVDDHTIVHTVINVSSPLRLDMPMCTGILEYSARNQCIIVTPFTLAGAMAPVTVAGALVLQNAEALAAIALTQLVRKGAPVVYGGFTSNVDMKSGSPAFGTPEYIKSAIVGGQLARRYNLPYRSSGVNAANAVDAQAVYESVFSLWGAIMGGANIVYHAAGWMEGGLKASFEKMVLDADLINMVAEFLEPLATDTDSLATKAIEEVGPGGHFFGVQHTQDRYRNAFFAPMISDWRNYETWDEAGSPTALDRATELVPQLLAEYEEPPMPEDRKAAIDEFVARRVAEGGVETDF